MNMKQRLLTTAMCTGLIVGTSACSHSASMTSNNTKMDARPTQEATATDARDAAENFIGHINYARIALAKNNGDKAVKHIEEARAIAENMQNTTTNQPPVAHMESGRIVYDYPTDYKYHYFPIMTGPVEIKKLGRGPMWAKNDLAVTDAEIVYLTIDLNGNKAEKRLDAAETDVSNGKLDAADTELAKLTDEVITADSEVSVPVDKARDNIMLARNFIASGNYKGASYALKHADSALNEMQNDDSYDEHRNDIIHMRHQVRDLQKTIRRNNPTVAQKAGAKMDKWWAELKDWSSSHS